MKSIKDFDLDLNTDDANDTSQPQARSTVICSIVYSIIGISAASTQFGGDANYTEASCH